MKSTQKKCCRCDWRREVICEKFQGRGVLFFSRALRNTWSGALYDVVASRQSCILHIWRKFAQTFIWNKKLVSPSNWIFIGRHDVKRDERNLQTGFKCHNFPTFFTRTPNPTYIYSLICLFSPTFLIYLSTYEVCNWVSQQTGISGASFYNPSSPQWVKFGPLGVNIHPFVLSCLSEASFF
jgi:hypothetical protein